MDVQVKSKESEEKTLELGDVIEFNGQFFLVVRTHERHGTTYVAKNFDGRRGLFGRFTTLEDMNARFNRDSRLKSLSTIYKPSEYMLQLVKKD